MTSHEWPSYGLASDVRPLLAQALGRDWPAAMVTLVAAEGAAPLGVGSQMLFAGPERAGFLSGGCVEGDVALHAAETVADGAPRRLAYGRGGPPDIRLLCGSRIELLVERLDPRQARRLISLGKGRTPALWLTDGSEQRCLAAGEPPAGLPAHLRRAYELALADAAPAGVVGAAAYRRFDPAPRLVLVGGDPIALGCARLAAAAGLEVALIRPKGPLEPPPIDGVRYLREAPAEALAALRLDRWTAVATLSHDLDLDHEALVSALLSPAFYVGALGSRRRIPERLERLRAAGRSAAEIERLRAPIGLEIGARSPFEIAVSVLAEVIAAFRAEDARRVWEPPVLVEVAG